MTPTHPSSLTGRHGHGGSSPYPTWAIRLHSSQVYSVRSTRRDGTLVVVTARLFYISLLLHQPFFEHGRAYDNPTKYSPSTRHAILVSPAYS